MTQSIGLASLSISLLIQVIQGLFHSRSTMATNCSSMCNAVSVISVGATSTSNVWRKWNICSASQMAEWNASSASMMTWAAATSFLALLGLQRQQILLKVQNDHSHVRLKVRRDDGRHCD